MINNVAGIGDNPCLPQSIQSTECAYYPSWYAGIEYIPYNPFVGGDLPANYDIAPFFRFAQIDTWFPDWLDDIFTGIIENTTGYLENDIFVSFLSLPTYQNPFDGLDYPTIKLTVQGTGILKLKFLLVPFGGRALISFDPVGIFDILQATWSSDDRIIELNRDILALVPETDVDAIEEIILDTDTTHEIYITFLPTINDEAPIFQYGGGFRGYELCGNLTVIDPASGLPIDFQNQQSGIYQEGIIVTTYQEFLDALDAHEIRKSSRYLLASDASNISGDITVDKDTNEIIVDKFSAGSLGGSAISGDISETVFGGGIGIGEGFRDIVAEIVLRRTTQSKTAQSVADSLRLFYFLNGLVDAVDLLADALGTKYTNATDTVTPTVIPEDVAKIVFCHGATRQSLYRYAQFIEDAGGTDALDIADWYRVLIAEILDEQIEAWYQSGTGTPRLGYESAECYRLPAQSITFDSNNFTTAFYFWYTGAVANRSYRLEIDVVAPFVNANGDKFDGVFYEAVGLSPVDSKAVRLVSSGTTIATSISPTYLNGAGKYVLEFSSPLLLMGSMFNNPPIGTVVSGEITLTLYDLGAN